MSTQKCIDLNVLLIGFKINSILGSNNGVLEMETVTLTTMDKDADIIPDCKPRSAFFKLKEALSSQLAAKRKEEILRRKADLVDMDKKSKRAIF